MRLTSIDLNVLGWVDSKCQQQDQPPMTVHDQQYRLGSVIERIGVGILPQKSNWDLVKLMMMPKETVLEEMQNWIVEVRTEEG